MCIAYFIKNWMEKDRSIAEQSETVKHHFGGTAHTVAFNQHSTNTASHNNPSISKEHVRFNTSNNHRSSLSNMDTGNFEDLSKVKDSDDLTIKDEDIIDDDELDIYSDNTPSFMLDDSTLASVAATYNNNTTQRYGKPISSSYVQK